MSTLTPHASAQTAGRTGASTPIADYGLLADCNSSALVDRSGSIDWLCLPRYDSDALFARLLDRDAGHWSIRPAAAFTAQRRY
ncbi:MAG TPA: trehalase-like domain-containing protein, partial [Solirubrobacteraceae bacterium]|nr:trehalase-like domain-containing protein [Solirubrobacteraceae bacterium]